MRGSSRAGKRVVGVLWPYFGGRTDINGLARASRGDGRSRWGEVNEVGVWVSSIQLLSTAIEVSEVLLHQSPAE